MNAYDLCAGQCGYWYWYLIFIWYYDIMIFKNTKLGVRMLIAFLFIGLIPFISIGLISVVTSGDALSKQAFRHLESMREMKKAQIESFFRERQNDMAVLMETVKVLRYAAFDKLSVSQETKKAQVETFFKERLNNLSVISASVTASDALNAFGGVFHAEGGKTDGPVHQYLELKYRDTFKSFKEKYKFSDLCLIDSDGNIVYSLTHGSEKGQNVVTGELKDSPLGKCFRKGLEGIAIQDFEPYTVSGNEYFAFMAAPVRDKFKQNKLLGVIVLKLSREFFNTIVHRRAGMGKTGETYLVGRQDDETAYRSDQRIKEGKIGDLKSGDDVDSALAGESGLMVKVGSTGKMEIVRYDPLEIPGLNWAMLTTVSLEALHSKRRMRIIWPDMSENTDIMTFS